MYGGLSICVCRWVPVCCQNTAVYCLTVQKLLGNSSSLLFDLGIYIPQRNLRVFCWVLCYGFLTAALAVKNIMVTAMYWASTSLSEHVSLHNSLQRIGYVFTRSSSRVKHIQSCQKFQQCTDIVSQWCMCQGRTYVITGVLVISMK